MDGTSTDLAPSEVQLLKQHELTIERGLRTFVEVGQALQDIRDSRLYRETHGNFEAYCDERWRMSRRRAYELIGSSEVVEVLSGIPHTPTPRNAGVADELAPLRDEPEQLRDAWTQTVERHGPEPTAAQTREVVQEIKEAAMPARTEKRSELAIKRLFEVASELRGMSAGIAGLPMDKITTITPEQRNELDALLGEAYVNIMKFRKILKKEQ